MLLSFCGTVAAILALRGWAHRVGLVDRPSSRKTHQGHVPLVGGLAIAAGFLAAVLFAESLRLEQVPLVAATVLVVAIGVVDDLHSVSALSRLLCEVAAAVVMVAWAGVRLSDFGDLWGSGAVGLNGLAFPVTVFCVVGVVNAMNMIDGMDGLAGGLAAVALLWLCLGAQAAGLDRGVALALILLCALGAFLLFNLPLPWRRRGTVFLGDAGSLLLGFLLAWYSVDLSQNSLGKFYAISTVWILGVPILDTVYVMLRRLARGNSPFQADRRHIHHTLVYMGFTQGQTLAILLGVSAVFGAIGYFGWVFRVPEYLLTFGFLGVFGAYCLFMQSWKPLFRALGIQRFVPKRTGGEGTPGPA